MIFRRLCSYTFLLAGSAPPAANRRLGVRA
jgi:hypothetical protein